MTILAGIIVTLIVWAVSVIRSVRWRGLVYSLPLPITLVLLTTSVRVDGGQLLGVVALNLFFVVVAFAHDRLGWPILVADLAGIATYLALGLLIAALSPVPFLPTLVAVSVLWSLAVALGPAPVQTAQEPVAQPAWPGSLIKLGTVFSASLIMIVLGGLLKGLIVTFPYSGVLVAVETRHHLSDFSRHFARNSIGLVAFFTAYYLLQDYAEPIALAGGWAAFAVSVITLHLRRSKNETSLP